MLNRCEEIVIPIVFHIIQEADQTEIVESELWHLMQRLNKAFHGRDQNEHTVPVWATPGDIGFKFKIAEIDPDGTATSGIIRRRTTIDKIADQKSPEGISIIKSEALGGSDAWNTEKYVNIWIGERSISLGSTTSSTSKSVDIEGVILALNALGGLDQTISHEMGHYFGLLHPWGNFTGCDGEDDGIADTPFQSFPDFQCSSVLNCGNYTLPGNIMDFNDDSCLLYFTRLQARSAQEYAMTFKSELINSSDCFSPNLPRGYDLIVTNVFYGSIEVYLDDRREIDGVKLISLDGKVLQAVEGKSQSFLNIPIIGIPPGIYVLVLQRGKELFSEKIIIKG